MQVRVKLEGQDSDWRVPVNPRHAHYTNLRPGAYRFRVIASNNSGVWNEEGAPLDFVDSADVVPDKLVPRVVRRRLPGLALRRLPAPCPATRAPVQHDPGGAGE